MAPALNAPLYLQECLCVCLCLLNLWDINIRAGLFQLFNYFRCCANREMDVDADVDANVDADVDVDANVDVNEDVDVGRWGLCHLEIVHTHPR